MDLNRDRGMLLQAPGSCADWLLRQAGNHLGDSSEPIDVSHPCTPPDSPFSDDGGVGLPVETADSLPSSGGARLMESNLTLLQSLLRNATSSADESEGSTVIQTTENSGVSFSSDPLSSRYFTSSHSASRSASSSGSGSDSWVSFEGSADSGFWSSDEGNGAGNEIDAFLRRLRITLQERSPPASLSQLPSLTSGETASTVSSSLSVSDSSGPSVIEYLPQLPTLESDGGEPWLQDEEPWYNDNPSIADSGDSVSQ